MEKWGGYIQVIVCSWVMAFSLTHGPCYTGTQKRRSVKSRHTGMSTYTRIAWCSYKATAPAVYSVGSEHSRASSCSIQFKQDSNKAAQRYSSGKRSLSSLQRRLSCRAVESKTSSKTSSQQLIESSQDRAPILSLSHVPSEELLWAYRVYP